MRYHDIFSFLSLNMETSRYDVPIFEEGDKIPKIIHQTYFKRELPDEIANSVHALKAKNPEWDYRLYDDDDIIEFIQKFYGDKILKYYFKIDKAYGAARADFFRYLLMYKCGGVYLDIKSSVEPPLDSIIRTKDKIILSQWSTSPRFEGAGIHDWDFADKIEGGEIQQWHIICAPGHPYLRQVIQNVFRNIETYIPGFHPISANGVLAVTGPIAYTLAIIPLLHDGNHRFVRSHEEIGLVYSIYDDNKHHAKLFNQNYKTMMKPVVHVNLLRLGLSAIYRFFNLICLLRKRMS